MSHAGIKLSGVDIPRTQTIGGTHVLPAGPYTPNLHSFETVNIAQNSLPAHNAQNALAAIHVVPPRPAPSVVVDHMAGAGGHPGPSSFTNMSSLPDVSATAAQSVGMGPSIRAVDRNIASYEMRGQGLSPDEPISYRPSHTLEIYGLPKSLDLSNLDIARHEVMLDHLPTNHGVDAVYGGSPFSEKASISIRPQPSNVRGPQFRVPTTYRAEPIISVPLRPAPPRINMPRIPRVSASPVAMEAKPVSPPLAGADMGIGAHAALLAGNSRNMGPIGVSSGRSFGPEGSMTPF